MIKLDLFTLLDKCKFHYKKLTTENHNVNDISENSQVIAENIIFIAIKGENHDGHDFLIDVINKKVKTVIYEDRYYDYLSFPGTNMIRVHDTKKAFAILAANFFNHPSLDTQLVGVTGTNGKTTVTTLMYHLFKLLKQKATIIGTNGISVGDLKVKTKNTTPGAYTIQKILSDSLKNSITNVVMEVSSHAIKQERISQLDFKTVIYTNFSHDHLDYHKTFEDYFYSKALIFSGLGNIYNNKLVLFNGDDKYYKRFLSLTHVEYYTYGIGSHNDFQARNIICDVDKISFHFYAFNEFIGIVNTNNIFGFFNIANLLACISYFYLKQYNMSTLLALMPELNGVKGRMEKVNNHYSLNIFVDYAHTPDSIYRVLKEIKLISRKRIITVVGCGGNRDPLKRPLIGKITTELSDIVIFTSDNPRYEDPDNIITEIVQGVQKNNFVKLENRFEAIEYAIKIMHKDDIVVILGKGHENYQIIKDEVIDFNDYEIALNSINKLYKGE